MMAALTIIGIDVSGDWLDGFCVPDEQRFRFPNTAAGHELLIEMIQRLPASPKVGFEPTGGQEWALWTQLVSAEIEATQLPPAQIKAFALSRGTRAKTDRIDAARSARFMTFRPAAGRRLPNENLRILRTLTTRRAQLVGMRKRLVVQIGARRKQGLSSIVDSMDTDLRVMLDGQIVDLEQQIERVMAREEATAAKAALLRSIPGIGPVCVAMLVAEMPALGQMTSGEAAAMTGLAPVPHDSGTIRGRRGIAGGRRALRRVLFQAALAAACHNPILQSVAKRLKERESRTSSSSPPSREGW
jgi:transposase